MIARRTPARTIARIPVVIMLVAAAGCDSGDPSPCELAAEDTYTASASLAVPGFDRIALFEFQQEVRSYQDDGSCVVPRNTDEISLRIRNVTACDYSFDYRLSIFEGSVGTTIVRGASVRQEAVEDQGVIITDGGFRVDRAQIILTGENVVQGICP